MRAATTNKERRTRVARVARGERALTQPMASAHADSSLPRSLRSAASLLTEASHAAAHALFNPHSSVPFRIFLDDACSMPSDWRANHSEETSDFKYSADRQIPIMLDSSPFVTDDWRRADASVVVLFARRFGGPAVAAERCRRRLARHSEAWRATEGARHFFILTGDRGPCCNDGTALLPQFLRHHVVGHHGEQEGHHWRYGVDMPDVGCFYGHKDISIPTPNQRQPPAELATTAGAPRNLLLFFSGAGRFSIDRHIFRGVREGRRMLLATFYKRGESDILVVPSMPRDEYRAAVQRARFCPIMGGFAPWTPRLVELIFAGCVPVIFSSWLLPFSRVIDWSKCSVRVASLADVPRLRDILEAQDYTKLAAGVAAARHALWYHVGQYTGDGALPFFLLEMKLALAEAERRPLASRVAELVGTAAPAGPLQHTVREQNRSLFLAGQTAILTERSGVMRRWECALRFGARPRHTFDPAEIYEKRGSGEHMYQDGTQCSCRRLRGPPSDEPISPTQRVLQHACTNLATGAARGHCTLFAGQPDGLERRLRPLGLSRKQGPRALPGAGRSSQLPFSTTGCQEAFCPRQRRRERASRGNESRAWSRDAAGTEYYTKVKAKAVQKS